MSRFCFSVSILLCTVAVGCGKLSDNRMGAVSGTYHMTGLQVDAVEVSVDRVSPEEIRMAELYEADGKWYFDCSLPTIDYHGGYSFRKSVLELVWNFALGEYLFPVSEETSKESIISVTVQNNQLRLCKEQEFVVRDVSSFDGFIIKKKTLTCVWERRP